MSTTARSPACAAYAATALARLPVLAHAIVANPCWCAHDTATLTGHIAGLSLGAENATATYSFYMNGECKEPAVSTQVVSVAEDGTMPPSKAQTLAPGSYSYKATYSGNGYYKPATGACEPFRVVQKSQITNTVLCTFDQAEDPRRSGGAPSETLEQAECGHEKTSRIETREASRRGRGRRYVEKPPRRIIMVWGATAIGLRIARHPITPPGFGGKRSSMCDRPLRRAPSDGRRHTRRIKSRSMRSLVVCTT